MAKTNSNYSILVDVELETSAIKKQLDDAAKNVKLDLDTKNATQDLTDLGDTMEDTSLTFQAANEIFSKSIEVISSMIDQVYELDGALTEFRKVSDLSGSALDDYVAKLSDMGGAVARTGKPKCQASDDGIANQHQEPLEIQYNLRAYSATMVA